MKTKPFFSIIIPTHNRAKFLKIAVESVLSQTFTDYELIIIDDGSTDKTQQMLAGFKDKRISYAYQAHQGVTKARNNGIRESAGEFICFLDSDDRFCQNKLEITYHHIQKQPQYKVFHSEEVWYRNGALLPQKAYHKKPSGDVFSAAVKLCCVSISTAAIQRKIFDQIGCFDENLPACEDYDFWLRVAAQFPIQLIPQHLTIKEGGQLDQQSKKYPAMDKFRIYALAKLLGQKKLSKKQYKIAYNELKNKCDIYFKGALKRGKKDEVKYYQGLIHRLASDKTYA